jgi:ABC-2 type transport system permease protein
MRKFFAMVRIFTKVIFGQMLSIKIGGKANKWAGPLLWGIVVLSLLPLAGVILFTFNTLFSAFAEIGQLETIVGMALNIGSLLIFMFSLMAAPAIFYFAKDVEYILPLPVKPTQIIGAKFLVAMLFEYLLALVLVVVMFIALWGHLGAGLLTFNMIVTLLTLPVLPMVYSTVIIMVLMRFVRFIRNPDRYNWFVGLIGLGLMLVFMSQSQNMFVINEEAIIYALTTGESMTISILNSVFFTNTLAARAIGNAAWRFSLLTATGYVILVSPPSIINIMLSQIANIVVATAGLAVFFLLAKLLYFKGVIGLSESGSSGKKMTRDELAGAAASQGAFKAYVMKELRVLFRSPVAFMNCVLMVLLMPIIMGISLVPLVGGGGDEGLIELMQAFNFGDPRMAALALAGVAVLSLLMAGSATITATAISREGRAFFVMKFLPVRYRTQLHAKAFCGLIVVFVGYVMVFAPLFVIFAPPVWFMAATVAIILPLAVFTNYLGLYFDLLKPQLEWDNEADAVKQNVNTILMIFGAMAIAVGIGFLGWRVFHTPMVAFGVIFGGSVVLMGLALYLALVKGAQLMRKL